MPVIIKDNSKLLAEIPLSLDPEDLEKGILKIYAGTPPDIQAKCSNLTEEDKGKIMAEFLNERYSAKEEI
jgi:hypothetical protein